MVVLADHGPVGGNLYDVQLVDGAELFFLRQGRWWTKKPAPPPSPPGALPRQRSFSAWRTSLYDVQLVDGAELFFLRQGRTGHAGELVIQAEVVLEPSGLQR